MENIATKGRMPTIRFSDSADYDTLRSVLNADGMPFSNGEPTHGWCLGVRLKNGYYAEVALFDSPEDAIGGFTWDEKEQNWSGEPKWFDLDDVEELIIL